MKLLFCLYTLLLFVITLLPAGVIQSEGVSWLSKFNIENGDKLMHFGLFFIFTALLFYSSFTTKPIQVWLIPLLTGILIEVLQYFLNWGRTFDLFDILANSLGIFLAYLLVVRKF